MHIRMLVTCECQCTCSFQCFRILLKSFYNSKCVDRFGLSELFCNNLCCSSLPFASMLTSLLCASCDCIGLCAHISTKNAHTYKHGFTQTSDYTPQYFAVSCVACSFQLQEFPPATTTVVDQCHCFLPSTTFLLTAPSLALANCQQKISDTRWHA